MILVLCETDPATGEVDEVSLETLAMARALSMARSHTAGATSGAGACVTARMPPRCRFC